MRGTRFRWIVAGAVVSALAACSPARPRNVLLVSIDTLRADHLGAYGSPKSATPHLDALAREGVRFENVLSPVPLTLPAHCSLLTGMVPPMHGVHDNLSSGLADSHTTLPELFQNAGFRTGAIVSSFVLDSRFNLAQGFESYDDEFEEEHKIAFLSERKGSEATERARAWLERHHRDRFFLFLHYYDPHDDYAPPAPFDSRFPSDPYAGEVAFVDHQVGAVLSTLRELEILEDTLVIVVSDHGEMLEEHGEATHGYFVYESALRVPLILRGARIPPAVIGERVGLIDVAPTVAGLFGLSFPSPTQGQDLSPLLRGAADSTGRRELYVESVTPHRYYGLHSLFGLVTGRWKYIYSTKPELYDLVEDPGETRNVVEENSGIASGMRGRIAEILEANAAPTAGADLDEDAVRRLASLGYLSGNVRGDAVALEAAGPELPDAKDWIGFYRDHQRLEKLVREERYGEARSLAERMLEVKPDFVAGLLQLGLIALQTERYHEARAHFARAIEREPENEAAHLHLAEALVRLKDNRSAIEAYRRLLELDPDSLDARKRLAALLSEEGEADLAQAQLRQLAAASPEDADAIVQLAVLLASRGSWDEAETELRIALSNDPKHGGAHLYLGTALSRRGELDQAIPHFERALETSSRPSEVHHQWGLALREHGRREQALEHLEKAVELDPNSPLAQNHLGLALKESGRRDEALERYRTALALDPDLSEARNNLGSLLASEGRLREAIEHFRRALESAPHHAEAHNNLGLALRMTGARDGASPHFRAALEARPDWAEPMTELAWILATHPDERGRSPEEALRLASRAAELTGRREPVVLDTLAAALAARGDFERAVGVAQEAVSLSATRAPALAKEIRARLDLYRQQRPFREPS